MYYYPDGARKPSVTVIFLSACSLLLNITPPPPPPPINPPEIIRSKIFLFFLPAQPGSIFAFFTRPLKSWESPLVKLRFFRQCRRFILMDLLNKSRKRLRLLPVLQGICSITEVIEQG
jgi:hypothetical protein